MAANNPNIKCYYYHLPSEKGEGWGYVVLTSDGVFAAYTDYGNCCYHWYNFGDKDFRQFILDLIDKKEQNYMVEKMIPEKMRIVFDGEATIKEIRKQIYDNFRNKTIDKHTARLEYENLANTLEYYEYGQTLEDFDEWADDTIIFVDAPYEMALYKYTADVSNFKDKFLPRLAEEIRKNIEEEK